MIFYILSLYAKFLKQDFIACLSMRQAYKMLKIQIIQKTCVLWNRPTSKICTYHMGMLVRMARGCILVHWAEQLPMICNNLETWGGRWSANNLCQNFGHFSSDTIGFSPALFCLDSIIKANKVMKNNKKYL